MSHPNQITEKFTTTLPTEGQMKELYSLVESIKSEVGVTQAQILTALTGSPEVAGAFNEWLHTKISTKEVAELVLNFAMRDWIREQRNPTKA